MVIGAIALRSRIAASLQELRFSDRDLSDTTYLLLILAFAAGMLLAPSQTLIAAIVGLIAAIWMGRRDRATALT